MNKQTAWISSEIRNTGLGPKANPAVSVLNVTSRLLIVTSANIARGADSGSVNTGKHATETIYSIIRTVDGWRTWRNFSMQLFAIKFSSKLRSVLGSEGSSSRSLLFSIIAGPGYFPESKELSNYEDRDFLRSRDSYRTIIKCCECFVKTLIPVSCSSVIY